MNVHDYIVMRYVFLAARYVMNDQDFMNPKSNAKRQFYNEQLVINHSEPLP
jgi:hypothetical protein